MYWLAKFLRLVWKVGELSAVGGERFFGLYEQLKSLY